MRLNWIRQTQSKLFIFGLIASVYFVQFYGIWALPFLDVNLPHPLDVYFMRTIQTVISLLMIWLVVPRVFKRFTFRFRPKTFWIGIAFTIIATIPNIYYFGVEYKSFWDLAGGIIFALAIGIGSRE